MRLLILTTVFNALLSISTIVANLLENSINSAVHVWISFIAVNGFVGCFVLRAGILFIAFNATNIELKIGNSMMSEGRFPTKKEIDHLKRLRIALSSYFQMGFLIFATLFTFLLQLLYVLLHPVLWSSVLADKSPGIHSDRVTMSIIGISMTSILLLILVYLAFKIRISVDSFNIKATLKHNGEILLMAMFFQLSVYIWLPHDPFWHDIVIIVYLFGMHCVCVVDLLFNIIATYKRSVPTSKFFSFESIYKQTATESQMLKQFLKTPEGFLYYENHLKSEFAVESLIFWREATNYRTIFPKLSNSQRVTLVSRIVDLFIVRDAPFELNLPNELIKQYSSEDFKSLLKAPSTSKIIDELGQNTHDSVSFTAPAPCISASIFKDVEDEVLSLMTGSLHRFLSLPMHKGAWDPFVLAIQEETILSEMRRISISHSSYTIN